MQSYYYLRYLTCYVLIGCNFIFLASEKGNPSLEPFEVEDSTTLSLIDCFDYENADPGYYSQKSSNSEVYETQANNNSDQQSQFNLDSWFENILYK